MERRERKLSAVKYFEEDFATFSSYVQGEYADKNVVRMWTTYFDVADGFDIPQSLLLGPWTEEMTKLLYWLVKGGAKLNWLTSTSGEVS
jgi:magnesium transporter